jgi:hypothetical protein
MARGAPAGHVCNVFTTRLCGNKINGLYVSTTLPRPMVTQQEITLPPAPGIRANEQCLAECNNSRSSLACHARC